MSCPPSHCRHWFRAYGVVALVAPSCVRCGAPNPRFTDQDREEWDAYWEGSPPREHWR